MEVFAVLEALAAELEALRQAGSTNDSASAEREPRDEVLVCTLEARGDGGAFALFRRLCDM